MKIFLSVLIFAFSAYSQGFHYLTSLNQHTLLYGRFEVRMKIVGGSGICNALCPIRDMPGGAGDPEWTEMDIEILGRAPNVIESVAHMGTNMTFVYKPWCWQLSSYEVSLEEDYHTYTIEWAPDHVSWGLDGMPFRRAEETSDGMIHDVTYNLNYPDEIMRDTIYDSNFLAYWRGRNMRFAFDLWDASRQYPDWAGGWDPANNSKAIIYSWFKHYEYTPGQGDFGQDFTLKAWDDFDGVNKSATCEWASVYGINYQDSKAVGNLGYWSGSPPFDPGDTAVNQPTPFPYTFIQNVKDRLIGSGDRTVFYRAGTVSFRLTQPGHTNVDLYNVNGKKVRVLVDANLAAGEHALSPNLGNICPGTYVITLKTPSQHSAHKMIKVSSSR
jgi:hypothetical protein